MWILTIGMGIFAALINLPIDDKPMARLSEQPKPATA
jgi:hypothetical protein